ncbi:MAG: FAD:protein FMN transferase [Planctomycetota bacterium]
MKRLRWLLSALLVVGACDGGAKLYRQTFPAMLGPVGVDIQVVADSTARADRAAGAAAAAISQVNNLLSAHLATSEIARINRHSGGTVHASGQTVEVLRRAVEISELTGGAFDVTVGPLIRIWKPAIDDGKLPDPAHVARARRLVGYEKLALGENSVTLTEEGMAVDLGGIAKGYAVDQAVEALRLNGIRNALVDAGGDGYALGTKPDGSPWGVAVQHPRAEGREPLPVLLLLSDKAYATSGDYARSQYTEIDGERYAHIIDPRTGRPARKAASVTVVAPDCTTADALATAISVMGPDAGVRLVDSLDGVECLVITVADGALHTRASSGFDALTAPGMDAPGRLDGKPADDRPQESEAAALGDAHR